MRKTFLKVSLLGMLTVGMAAGFTSCKDYDDDVKNLQTQIDAIQKDLKSIQDLVSSGVVITNVAQNADGITINMSNGQSYNITNGKDGAAGKDADVWTIVKNDKGEYMWAKNDVITEFPAQGPAGTAVAGSYYVPNAETGVFDEHKADGTVVPTTIPCFAKGSLTAVDDGSNIIISGILDEDGNETEPFVLSKTGALSSLEFIPDLYVDGIEAMPARYMGANIAKETGTYAQNTATDESSTILKGELKGFGKETGTAAAKNYAYRATETAQYFLNPTNANTSKVQWSFFTNDATIRNRASEAVAEVKKAEAKDGVLTVDYKLGDINDVFNADGAEIEGVTDGTLQTIMALQATLEDNSVVYSNFVAVEKQQIELGSLQYTTVLPGTNASFKDAATTSSDAVDKNKVQTIAVPYDATTNLPSYIRVSYTVNGDDSSYTLKQLQDLYGMTAEYSILKYDRTTNDGVATAQNNYGQVDANGVFTPGYIKNGAWVSGAVTPNNDEIGRCPVVIVKIKGEDGKLILGGFVRLEITKMAKAKPAITFENKPSFVLSCNGLDVEATGAEFNQEVLVEMDLSAQNFDAEYEFDRTVIGVLNETTGEIEEFKVDEDAVFDRAGTPAYIGQFGYKQANATLPTSKTQWLYFTATFAQLQNWYPHYNNQGAYDNNELTATPKTKKLYAKFQSKTSNAIQWIGWEITVTGVPTITNVAGYLARWNAAHTMAPVNPADPAVVTMTDASVITVSNMDLWSEGNPIFTATAPYNFDKAEGDNYVAAKPFMCFATAQSFTLAGKDADGKAATIRVKGNGAELIAYTKVKNNGEPDDGQPIATIIGGDKIIKFEAGNAGSYVNQIITSAPYSVENPTILFDVELKADYSDGTCGPLYAPAKKFQIGVGNPVIVSPATPAAQVTDHGTTDQITLPVGNIISIKDWAGNPFFKNGTKTETVDGKTVTVTDPNSWVGNEIISGRWVFSYWMGSTNGIDLDVANIKGSTTGSEDDAVVYSNVEVTVADGETGIRDFNKLVTITNKGTQFTQDVTIFIPVTVNAIWGPFTTTVPVKIVKTDKGSN